MKIYQWTKGEKQGSVVKTDGDTFIEDNIEFLVFKDGSMINAALISEYLLELPTEQDAFLIQDLAPTPLQRKPPAQEAPPPTQVQVQENRSSSPIESLLSGSKRTREKFTVMVEVDLPPAELMKVIADSYEDGEEKVLQYVSSTIPIEEVRDLIAEQIKKSVFEKKRKRNERLQSTPQ
jgi:hypothetical protein